MIGINSPGCGFSVNAFPVLGSADILNAAVFFHLSILLSFCRTYGFSDFKQKREALPVTSVNGQRLCLSKFLQTPTWQEIRYGVIFKIIYIMSIATTYIHVNYYFCKICVIILTLLYYKAGEPELPRAYRERNRLPRRCAPRNPHAKNAPR